MTSLIMPSLSAPVSLLGITFIYFFFWQSLAACGILVPQPGIESVTPSLEMPSLTTGSPGRSQDALLCCTSPKLSSLRVLPLGAHDLPKQLLSLVKQELGEKSVKISKTISIQERTYIVEFLWRKKKLECKINIEISFNSKFWQHEIETSSYMIKTVIDTRYEKYKNF